MSALGVIFVVMFGYVATLCVTFLASQPARIRLAALADELLEEARWNSEERDELEWMVASSSSTVVGLVLPFASLGGLAAIILGATPHPQRHTGRLYQDQRFGRMMNLYIFSVAACSPFATLASVPFILSAMLVLWIRGRHELKAAVEGPIMSASSTFQPC